MLKVLYLVRHSKAEASHPDGDRHRALSPEGRARISAMLPQAVAKGVHCDLSLASPYLRAVQTQELFAPAFASKRSAFSGAFTPGGDLDDAFAELQAWEADGCTSIAVFTHNPFVTLLASALLERGQAEPTFHTPTIWALEFDHGLRPRAGRTAWILNP